MKIVKFLRIASYIEHLWWLLLSENLTAVHLGFSYFMHGSPAENLAGMHLRFSYFMHGSPAKNLIPMHLGFSNFMHSYHACRQGVTKNKLASHFHVTFSVASHF